MAQVRVNKTMTRIFSGTHRVLYKISKGKVGGKMADAKIAILTTTGRKSGKEREVPIIAEADGDGWLIVASYSGHDEHPGWYHNLKAQPSATLQVGDGTHPVVASELDGEPRDKAWAEMAAVYPDYTAYQGATDRQIPVLRLART